MFVKVCGMTRLSDARHAVQQGATAVGFVFWPRSPRYITPAAAAAIAAELPSSIVTVGVFVNEPVEAIRQTMAEARLSAVQLHGDEPPAYAAALPWPVLRSTTLDGAAEMSAIWPVETTLLLDAADRQRRGGTGMTVDWHRAAALARVRPFILAGGLTPDNVAEAVAVVRPYGIDVSSGVEESPGVKDFAKVTRFLASARDAFARP
jgi:phosphoribosylanthranilate isomerase